MSTWKSEKRIKEVKDIETDFPISGNLGGAHSKVKKMKKMKKMKKATKMTKKKLI